MVPIRNAPDDVRRRLKARAAVALRRRGRLELAHEVQ